MTSQLFPSLVLNRRRFLQVVGGATGVLGVAACMPAPAPVKSTAANPSTADTPQRGGVLRVVLPDGVTQLDPARPQSLSDIQLGYLAYDSLTAYDRTQPDNPILPRLAESWELSEDGLIYTFHLRPNATFQTSDQTTERKPVTAADVVYTFQRLLDPAAGLTAGATLSFLERVEAVDAQTVQFHLKTPNVTLPITLNGVFYAIVPEGATNEQLSQGTMGSGPFQLTENVPGERTVLKRNENYWNPDLPYLDEVQLVVIPEIAGQVAALTSDTVDVVAVVGYDQVSLLETTPSITLLETQAMVHLFVMQVFAEPFADGRVRQAFKHAIDRVALQQALLRGRGAVGNDQIIAPGNPFWADVPPLAYDVEKAKALLAEAGYGDGLDVTLTVADLTPGIVDTAVALQEMVKAAGITITLDKVDVNTYLTEKYGQTPFFIDYTPAPEDPDFLLSFLFITNAPYNVSGWSDPKVDELVTAARMERDLAQRKQFYSEVQQHISQDGPVLAPYFAPSFMAVGPAVHGIKATALVRAEAVWLQS